MKEKFPSLFAALAVEEMQMSEEGAFMNMDLLATLNAKIEAMTKEAADAKALAESLTAEKEALTAAHEQAITELKAANDKAIEDLNAEHTAAIEAKDAEIKTLTENAGKADETLKAKDDEIAFRTSMPASPNWRTTQAQVLRQVPPQRTMAQVQNPQRLRLQHRLQNPDRLTKRCVRPGKATSNPSPNTKTKQTFSFNHQHKNF